jgi:TonB family protein
MAELLWIPPGEVTPAARTPVTPSRLGRFLGFSAALHLGLAALTPWLALTARPGGEELVRPIDFFPDAGGGGAPPRSGPAPAPSASRPGRTASAARGDRRPTPPPTPVAPAPAPTPPSVPEPLAPPTPLPGTGDIPVGTPKVVGTPDSGAAVAVPRPTPVAPPTLGATAVTPSEGTDARAPALARELAAGEGDGGPRATLAIPRELVGRGGGGIAGVGPDGTGRGARPVGAGTGGAGQPGGGGTVDAADPDFTEYFRLIERRVRAVWQFPPQLKGTTHTVKLGFALRLDGTLDDVRVLSSTSVVLDESAQSAMQRATPFPPLPLKFRALIGQHLVMSFTVTVK